MAGRQGLALSEAAGILRRPQTTPGSPLYRLLFLACWLILAAPSRSENWTTEEVFARHKDAVLQVRIIDTGGGAKRRYGSGFLVSDDGLLLTNFHVIADVVHHPEQHRAEWLDSSGQSGPLQLIDVDVVHDLAVMRAGDLSGRPFLAVESNLPKMGERMYSLGFPYDLGLTIVEGTYNGLIEKSLYERIHLTASINPGMSGGPTIDRFGNVIGVNVASAGDQVGFLVPARYVIELLQREDSGTPGELMARIGKQLRDNQARYLSALLAEPFVSTRIGPYEVPGALARFVHCWSQTEQDKDRLFDETELYCQTEDDVFLADSLSTGAIRFEHSLRRQRKTGLIHFWALMERQLVTFFGDLGGDRATMTEFKCQSDFLRHEQIKSRIVLCVRRYREFPDLYDIVQRQVTLDQSQQSLQSTLVLTGVDREHGLGFARRFAESIRRSAP
jgi:hypothetical protein